VASRRRSATITVALAGTITAGALGALTGPAAAAPASGRSTLPGSQAAWATSSALQGAAAAADTVDLRVYLPLADQAAAERTALAVSTPGSSSYGKYLTPAQFRQQFGPSASSRAAVANYLKSSGFTIDDSGTDKRYVAAEGTVTQAQAAFGATLGEYSVAGQTLRAPESAVTLPSSIAGSVQAIVGLDQSYRLLTADTSNGNGPNQNHGAPGVGFRAGQPCGLWYGEKTVTTPSIAAYGSTTKPLAPCGYTPAQVRGLYGLGSPTDASSNGSGQTVAFVGANASPTLVQDVTQYSKLHGLPTPSVTQDVAPGVFKHPDTVRQVPGDFYGEETLDAEAIHTTAPGASLLYVASSNANQDFDASINHIVDKGLASIISISYGFTGEQVPQGFINSLNSTFIQAAAEGIGVYVSSGDGGDEVATLGSPAVDFYADSPFVTAVGGTSAAVVPTGTAPAGLSYTATDDPSSPLNQPGWKAKFQVGWQTGLDRISSTATLSPTATSQVLPGTLTQPLPGAFQAGGGGGVSTVFAEPSYQAAAGIKASGRSVPDLSALADPNTGLLVGQTQAFSNGTYYDEYRIGGTSVAAPLTAGLAALANQKAGAALGFLNPRIYGLYKAGNAGTTDVDQADTFGTTTNDPLPSVVRVNYVDSESAAGGLSYSLRTQEDPQQTLHSTPGYDTATGVGTPTTGWATAIAVAPVAG